MGKIIRNGIEYGGTYDSATAVNYDNSVSGLNARTVQEGIDQLNESLDNINVYVGEDKKLHFVDSEGADSVLPFSGNSVPWLENIADEEKCFYAYVRSGGSYYAINTDGISKIHVEVIKNSVSNIRYFEDYDENVKIGELDAKGGVINVSNRTDTIYLRLWGATSLGICKIWVE